MSFYIPSVLIGVCLLLTLYQLREQFVNWRSKIFLFAFSGVVFSTFSFLWVYQSFYSGQGDVFSFFYELQQYDAGQLSEALIRQPRVKYFIMLVYPFYCLGLKTLLGTSLLIALFGLVCKWLFFQSFKGNQSVSERALCIALFCLPSFVFWTSGFTKESLVVSLVLLFLSLLLRKSSWGLFLTLPLVGLIFLIKPYVFLMLFTFLGLFYLLKVRWKSRLLLVFTLGVLSLGVAWFYPVYSPWNVLNAIEMNNEASLLLTGGSNVSLWGDSILLKAIFAFFTALFRPFIWEASSVLSLFQAMEKLVLAGLVVAFFITKKENLKQRLNFLMLAWVVVFSTLLMLAVPNLGSMSRYSVYFMPVLLYLLLANMSWEKSICQSTSKSKAMDQGEIHQPTPNIK